MSFNYLLSVAAATALLSGVASTASAQPQTERAAAAATGKASTSLQGTARAVRDGAAPVAGVVAGAAQPAGAQASASVSTPRVVAAGDLIETARKSGQFTTFIKAADATNLTGVLKTSPNLTVFAPTDAAFAALPAGELDRLMADKAALQKLMTHHVINARVDSSKIKGAKGPVNTVANEPVELDGSGEVLRADNAAIVQADILATNGVLHVVDKVLMGAATGAAAPASATAPAPAPAPAAASATAPATTAGTPQ
jgi:uncharacterized surface protein with fasciclin (FAS1) repeats